jgi:hypothetical protein
VQASDFTLSRLVKGREEKVPFDLKLVENGESAAGAARTSRIRNTRARMQLWPKVPLEDGMYTLALRSDPHRDLDSH